MDKNSIIGIVLIFLIFFGFSIYNNKRNDKVFKAEVAYADSLYTAGNLTESRSAYITALSYKPKDQHAISRVTELNGKILPVGQSQEVSTDTIASTNPAQQTGPAQKDPMAYGAFSIAAEGKDSLFTIENSKVKLTVSTKGGRVYSAELKDYTSYDSLPVVLFSGDSTVFGYNFFTNDNKAIRTNDLYFTPGSSENHIVVKDKPCELKMRLPASQGGYIEYTYTMYPDNYMIDFGTKFVSLSDVVQKKRFKYYTGLEDVSASAGERKDKRGKTIQD